MDEYDANYIHNKFSELHARLDNLQNSISEQLHLLVRQLDSLDRKISDLERQRNNGNMKMAGIGGVLAGAIVELANYLKQ